MGWPIPVARCQHVIADPMKKYTAGRCRSCYDREWRMSQGPDSPYIRRARTPHRFRSKAS